MHSTDSAAEITLAPDFAGHRSSPRVMLRDAEPFDPSGSGHDRQQLVAINIEPSRQREPATYGSQPKSISPKAARLVPIR
jgi:hypothetical protein